MAHHTRGVSLPKGTSPLPAMRTPPKASSANKLHYVPVTMLEVVQALRTLIFNTSSSLYVVESNSNVLRICSFPDIQDIQQTHVIQPANVVFKKTKNHKGSIYCLTWNAQGKLIVTGSNDKSVKLTTFCLDSCTTRAFGSYLFYVSIELSHVCKWLTRKKKNACFEDLRASEALMGVPSTESGSTFASVCVDPSGHLLSSGREDASVIFTW